MKTTLFEIQKLIQNNEAVLIYFSNDRCAPCISLRPKVLSLLQTKFPKMKMEFIEAESAADISGHYSVFACPTILLFFDGKETKRYSKYVSVGELDESIKRHYEMIFE